MIPIPNHRKKKLGFFCIDISVTHGFNYRPRLFESFACTWQWHELCFSFVFGCIFFLLHFFLHSVASLISFTIINSCMLFYILFFVCVWPLSTKHMEHLCFSPISIELSVGFCQNHIAIFFSFLLNPRDNCSFSASFPHPAQFPVFFRQAASSNPWRLRLQTTSYIRLCHHQLQPTTCHNRQEGPT